MNQLYIKDYSYTEEDFLNINKCESFKDLFRVAENLFQRIPQPIIQVCGPITTGGRGNIEENVKVFEKAIEYLKSKGLNVFNQIPFEEKIAEFYFKWKSQNPNEKYYNEILDDFYLPVFKTGFIKQLWFIPGWEDSIGSKWERKQGTLLGIEILDIPEDFEKNI